jgi:hypothetical protein
VYHEIRWTREKLRQRLELVASLVYRRIQPLPPFEYRKLDRPRIDALQAAKETTTSWQTIPWNTYSCSKPVFKPQKTGVKNNLSRFIFPSARLATSVTQRPWSTSMAYQRQLVTVTTKKSLSQQISVMEPSIRYCCMDGQV